MRGQPFSRYNPQFNRERFRDSLIAAGMAYQWLGDSLSGRPKDPNFYGPDGKVIWARLQEWPALQSGLEQVLHHAGELRVALVCAEEDPMRCHRRSLLTPPLTARGVKILHIRGDGRIEPEKNLARRDAKTGDDRQLNLFGGS